MFNFSFVDISFIMETIDKGKSIIRGKNLKKRERIEYKIKIQVKTDRFFREVWYFFKKTFWG